MTESDATNTLDACKVNFCGKGSVLFRSSSEVEIGDARWVVRPVELALQPPGTGAHLPSKVEQEQQAVVSKNLEGSNRSLITGH